MAKDLAWQAVRYKEFQKEEIRRKQGRPTPTAAHAPGSSEWDKRYAVNNGAQETGVSDGTAHKQVERLNQKNTQPHSSPDPYTPNSK
jgi:hypothetical protein